MFDLRLLDSLLWNRKKNYFQCFLFSVTNCKTLQSFFCFPRFPEKLQAHSTYFTISALERSHLGYWYLILLVQGFFTCGLHSFVKQIEEININIVSWMLRTIYSCIRQIGAKTCQIYKEKQTSLLFSFTLSKLCFIYIGLL